MIIADTERLAFVTRLGAMLLRPFIHSPRLLTRARAKRIQNHKKKNLFKIPDDNN